MKKINKILSANILTLIIISVSISNQIFAQNIPAEVQNELNGYEKKIEQYKTEKNTQLELEYLNKAAFLCWNNQINDKAINHFQRVLELNEQKGNLNGSFLSTNYIGMIYDETQNYNSAITYFKKALDYSKKLK